MGNNMGKLTIKGSHVLGGPPKKKKTLPDPSFAIRFFWGGTIYVAVSFCEPLAWIDLLDD